MQNEFILTPFFLDQAEPQLETLLSQDWILNKPSLTEGDSQFRMSILHEVLAKSVETALRMEKRPVSIVGDCCATIGFMAGLQRAGLDPTLIWFDAHGDFNTWETTPSGFLGGMPLAMLVGCGEQRMPRTVCLQPVPEERVILTDARDLDPGEQELVESSNIIHLPKVSDLLNHPLPDRPLYIHFDVDVLDPGDVPALSYPAPEGSDVEELKRVFEYLTKTRLILGMSMSTWNPDIDEEGKTQDLCMEVFNVLLEE